MTYAGGVSAIRQGFLAGGIPLLLSGIFDRFCSATHALPRIVTSTTRAAFV